ncbi:hypothetical protein M434DRAFT_394057 [Hypoxylon sp. CO27-5]|nr:hypothetical protein M434DRAFT_394057 [Hypoxylon sp. CO27-5]
MIFKKVENADLKDGRLFEQAVENDKEWLVDFLVKHNADVNRRDKHGWTLGWIAFANMPKDRKHEARSRDLPKCTFKDPTCWSEEHKTKYVKFVDATSTSSRLRAHFGMVDHGLVVFSRVRSAVRTDHPVPPDRLFYFEIRVIEQGRGSKIYIGWSNESRQPNSQLREDLCYYCIEPFEGDNYNVFGCGIDMENGTAFFTRGGVRLTITRKGIKGRVYPTVCVFGNAKVVANFTGEIRPFHYDIEEERRIYEGVSPSELGVLKHLNEN